MNANHCGNETVTCVPMYYAQSTWNEYEAGAVQKEFSPGETDIFHLNLDDDFAGIDHIAVKFYVGEAGLPFWVFGKCQSTLIPAWFSNTVEVHDTGSAPYPQSYPMALIPAGKIYIGLTTILAADTKQWYIRFRYRKAGDVSWTYKDPIPLANARNKSVWYQFDFDPAGYPECPDNGVPVSFAIGYFDAGSYHWRDYSVAYDVPAYTQHDWDILGL
jgi:hypothetical protein